MAILSDRNERKVIPVWNTVKYSTEECRVLTNISLVKYDISKSIKAWNENHRISYAGDLISSAIICNNLEDPAILEAADYIIQSEEEVPVPLIDTCRELLSLPTLNHDNLSSIKAIAKLKMWLIKYPSDAIAHIEIARLYLVLGQIEKAENHIKYALYIDSNNRYVVRCACRFYIHINQIGLAMQVIKKSSLLKGDPWLLASEIAVNQVLGKSSKYLKRGKEIIDSRSYQLSDITELASAIATEEFLFGNIKKSKKLFNTSLISPNSNSLAQAQWFVSKEKIYLGIKIPKNDKFDESLSLESMYQHKFKDALVYAKQWIKKYPFSTRAISLGDTIATLFLRDYKSSETILRDAMKTHQQNAWLANNLAYALALDGRVEEAEMEINKVNKKYYRPSLATDICIQATKGLIEFKKKNIETGIALYHEAIQSAKSLNDPQLVYSALLNFSRELLTIDSSYEKKTIVKQIMSSIPEIADMNPLYSIWMDVKNLLETEKK